MMYDRQTKLQWGRGCDAADTDRPCRDRGCPPRCFNGAAAVMPRIRPPVSRASRANRELQWGRGCDAADTEEVDVREVSLREASMGPRL